MSVSVGINGFGRVGRAYLRQVLAGGTGIEVVAVNDVADSATLARLLRCDPAQLAWREHGVEVVIESTGKFRTGETAVSATA